MMRFRLVRGLWPVAGLWLVAVVAVLGSPAFGDAAVTQAAGHAHAEEHAHVKEGEEEAEERVAEAALHAFVQQARDGTMRYHDRARAIAEGFRPLGPDAPAMGRHWIHASRVLSGEFDPARPAGLTYIVVDGTPVLSGVFYVLPLAPGDRPPAIPGAAAAPWHYHNGDLSDEALLSVHDPVRGSDGAGAAGLRIAVLHAWVWADNPAGLLVPDNWSLPFVRLGLSPPASSPPASAPRAAMAVSLATDEGRDFFASRVRQATGRTIPGVDDALRTHGQRVRDRLSQRDSSAMSMSEMAWLEDAWRAATNDVLSAAPPTERDILRGALETD